MVKKKVIVKAKYGLHMRVAGRIIELCKDSRSQITVRKEDRLANAHSILELIMLAAPEGSELELIVDGDDEEKVLVALEEVLLDGGAIEG